MLEGLCGVGSLLSPAPEKGNCSISLSDWFLEGNGRNGSR